MTKQDASSCANMMASKSGIAEKRLEIEEMVDRRQFVSRTAATFLALRARSAFGALSSELLLQDRREFVLQNSLDNPFYAWPRTLLSYPIADDAPISPRSHRLLSVETKEEVPFQISRPTQSGFSKSDSEILFFSDLPAGATRSYRLDPSASGSSGNVKNSIKISRTGRTFTVDAGPIQVRIPASQRIAGDVPGPIIQISRGGKWTGVSTFNVPSSPVFSIHTEEVESGPLRSTHRITYTFAGEAKYIATVQCSAGIDFVRLHEDMEAMPETAEGTFDFAWSGCEFAYRQAPNHPWPDNFSKKPLPRYTDYEWEPIAPHEMDTQFGVSAGVDAAGKLPYSVRLFEPWGDVLAASFANFWGNSSPDAAAIFIDRPEQWEDHEYAIWHSSARLAVEFVYTHDTLHFVWKLARGTRSTCVAFYDHERDVEAMTRLEEIYKGIQYEGARFSSGIFPTSHALELQNWYGTLNLNKTKDWLLSYPVTSAVPKPLFDVTPWTTADVFYDAVIRSDYVSQLALSGVRQNHGFGPGSHVEAVWIAGFQVFGSQLQLEQRQRLQAILLLLAYVFAGEDMMPMQRMLAGHPNFLADVKSYPPATSFLFPEHPAADTWADEWEAYLRLNTRYHTRPAVEAWEARGGRWTENLGTYVWASLRPAVWTSFLLKRRDGYERLVTPQLASMGDWLVNALSAPFAGEGSMAMKLITEEAKFNRSHWGVVRPSDGPRRVHSPIGAHSERRKPPRSMWYLGTALRNYSPLVAEYMMWAARPTDEDMEPAADGADCYGMIYSVPDNLGTNPHLCTSKYTGYGITLRAAVDTPRELSIHLVQIDDGPNYRWGNGSEGANGVVYFYANGKGFSFNGREDVGDRIDQNTDFSTSFGVWKNATFRGIGQNVLTQPLYDLELAQFAEIVPRQGPTAVAWPEYVSRSIMLAGDDYFILHDKVFNPQIHHRFSWFVRKGDDFPHITKLSGFASLHDNGFTSVETETTSGRWMDGAGDSLALITHKEGIHAEATVFGARVTLPDGNDLLFASQESIEFHDEQNSFAGMAGLIRNRYGAWEAILFHGTRIAASGFSFATSTSDLGIAATLSKNGAASGHFFAPTDSEITIGLPLHSEKLVLYIDGRQAGNRSDPDQLKATIPAGAHRWELTASLPKPSAPAIERTEYKTGGAIVHGIPVSSASSYSLQISSDNAQTWKEAGKATDPVFQLAGLVNGSKYHVRLLAHNADHLSEPGPEYPLYITQDRPSAPDGLHVELSARFADLRWGEVLGVTEYRLYRRKKGEARFRLAYTGRATAWKDVNPAILPSVASPLSSTDEAAPVWEYYVTSSNPNGESRPSRSADTDPASWRNWNSTGDEPFRRTVERTEGQLPNDGWGRYYPK